MSSVLDRSRIELAPAPGLEAPAPVPSPPGRPGVEGARSWLSGWLRRLRGLPAQVAKPRWRRVPLSMQAQLQTQWCWAACATSASHLYDAASTWTQCRVVNAELTQTGCCQDGSSGQCNQPWYLDLALTRTGNLAGLASGTVPLSRLRSELAAGRPVGARIGWAGGGGHFAMISGCLDDATGILEVRDSIYGASEISIAAFVSSYQGSGSWTHTYYTER
jgi:Papain-like cysteine protease AvrRpt2